MAHVNRRTAIRYSLFVGLACAFAAGLTENVARGQESEVSIKVASLFKSGWKPSIKGLKEAQAHYEEAQQIAPRDMRVPYAMALVSIQNHRYKEAASQLDQALKAGQPLLPIRRVRIYVAVMMKDHSATAREMRALADKLSGPELVGTADKPNLEAAQFLGSIFEFLANHAGAALKPAELAALDADLKGKLKEGRAEAFQAGRDETTKQGKSLIDAVKAEKQKAQDIVDAQFTALKNQETANVTADKDFREKNEAARVANEPQAKVAEGQIAGINSQIGSLETERKSEEARLKKIEDGIKSDINSCERKISALKSKIKDIERKAKKDDDKKPDTRDEERDIEKLEREVSGLNKKLERGVGSAKLTELEGQIKQKEGEIQNIRANNPALRFMHNYRSTLAKFAAEIQTIIQERAKVQDVQDKYDKTDNINPATNALIIKSKAFTNFVELSLDDEKERLLATYKSK